MRGLRDCMRDASGLPRGNVGWRAFTSTGRVMLTGQLDLERRTAVHVAWNRPRIMNLAWLLISNHTCPTTLSSRVIPCFDRRHLDRLAFEINNSAAVTAVNVTPRATKETLI
jgi:hypothetical protein